jgi:ribonuclease R
VPVPRELIARVVDEGSRRVLAPLFAGGDPIAIVGTIPSDALAGAIVAAAPSASGAAIVDVVARAGTARADLWAVLAEVSLDPAFPDDVLDETDALLAAPRIDDPRLVDLSGLPFVTIDGPTSRDLDQALFIERVGDGYRVHYALADAAHYVPPRSALFREALRRAASYYLPGLSVPMLPRALSEGIVSLNPGVDRRALTFSTTLDGQGRAMGTEVVRARLRSRAKLAFGDVEAFHRDPGSSPLRDSEAAESLLLLREVGRLLLRDASARHVARYARREVDIALDDEGASFTVAIEPRLETELYNEQLSLLCNAEGARLLVEGASPEIQPIYRVHGAPDAARLAAFALLTQATVDAHGPDVRAPVFRADDPEELLADYLKRLETEPPPGVAPTPAHRLARALMRQAILVNAKSIFATSPSAHFGVGADVYARFSAPMREVVGVFVHKEMVELEGLRGGRVAAPPVEDREVDEALRVLVVDAANRAKDTQRKVNDLVGRTVIDRLFAADVRVPQADRPRRVGTVMGIASSKVHVALDAPPIDVKIFLRDLGRARRGAWLEVRREGAELWDTQSNERVLRLGDSIEIVCERREEAQARWVLLPARR